MLDAGQENVLDYRVLYLTTTGHQSGLPREIEIWFVACDGKLYLLAEHFHRAHWVRNIECNPSVRVRIGGREWRAMAHALDEEHSMRASELAEMLSRIRETQLKRDEFAASAGGDQARSARAADDLYDELDRMANAIGDAESGPRGRTTEDLDREYADLHVDPWAPVEPPRVDYDARLSELKRRMQSE